MEQFWALCSISRLSNSSSLFSRTLYQTWLPFRRRPAVPTTPRHKYPSRQSTFHLSVWPSFSPLSSPMSFSLPDSPVLYFFSIHNSLLPAPVKTYLLPCFAVSLCVSPPFFQCKISLLWSLTEHIFTPRYPQSHFPLPAFQFTLNYSYTLLNLITLQSAFGSFLCWMEVQCPFPMPN